jgi:hypothetical protein
MNINFLQDGDTWIAIASDCIFRKQHCEELWFAEINRFEYPLKANPDKYIVFWEEDFATKYDFDTLESAKGYILTNYQTKTPLIIGNREDI